MYVEWQGGLPNCIFSPASRELIGHAAEEKDLSFVKIDDDGKMGSVTTLPWAPTEAACASNLAGFIASSSWLCDKAITYAKVSRKISQLTITGLMNHRDYRSHSQQSNKQKNNEQQHHQ